MVRLRGGRGGYVVVGMWTSRDPVGSYSEGEIGSGGCLPVGPGGFVFLGRGLRLCVKGNMAFC